MNERKKNLFTRAHVGMPSIILIVVILGMAVFAVLSFKSSLSEITLAENAGEHIKEYYEINANAEEILARVDGVFVTTDFDKLSDQLSEIEEVLSVDYIATDQCEVEYECRDSISGESGILVKLILNNSTNDIEITEWKSFRDEIAGAYELLLTD